MKRTFTHISLQNGFITGLLPIILTVATAAIPFAPPGNIHLNLPGTRNLSAPATPSSFVRTETSVLSTGNWYKLAVRQSGVHRISYQELVLFGLDPAAIDPRHIRLYSNGSGMLPELNEAPRPDDLTEIAIYVSGEEDGRFDTGDQILFYGESQTSWSYNPFNGNFVHSDNLYSDTTCYFLTADLGPGKRIGQIPSTDLPPTDYVTSFNDFRIFEEDLNNLIKSGKDWYGRKMDQLDSVALIAFEFPDLDTDHPINLELRVAAKSTASSTFTVYYNSLQVAEAPVTGIPPTSTTIWARKSRATESFMAGGSPIELRIAFWAPTTTSYGWIDYLELNAMRQLVFRGDQLPFRNADITGRDKVAKYFLSGVVEQVKIWEVTDPFQVAEVETEMIDDKMVFTLQADSLREFVAFGNDGYLTPDFIDKIDNQNLHGLQPANLVIVSHPLFLEQATELGEMHLTDDGLTYLVVTPEQIYNEFSGGSKDISAIRDFVRMLYFRSSEDQRLRYLLLIGDGSFDPKERNMPGTDLIPTFQSEESLQLTSSFVTDDFYGLLDDTEGLDATGIPDIGIGRFPVNTVEEVRHILHKINYYLDHKEEVLGSWRNQICFLADDEDLNLHFNQAEELAYYVDSAYMPYNINKIYFDAFPQVSTPVGMRYPDAKKALNKQIEEGALIINYTGHGGETGWAGEQVLESSDINGWTNIDKLPLFVTATCEFSRFDDYERTSAGELVFLNNDGGGIGLITTTRLAFAQSNFQMNKRFYKYALKKSDDGQYPRLGDLIRLSKTHPENNNIRNIVLLGDPALQLAYPHYKIETTGFMVNGKQSTVMPDTVRALSEVTVNGEIRSDDGVFAANFNGTLYPLFYDKPEQFTTLANDPRSKQDSFFVQKNILFKGNVSVIDGQFSFTFLVPRDISFNFGNGRLSYYAMSTETDASGFYEDFILGGIELNGPADLEGPAIELYLNDRIFQPGDMVNPDASLLAFLADPSGISSQGITIGHDIVATLDGETGFAIVLNDYFELDPDSYQSGQVIYPFVELEEGPHTLTLKAWDLLNNSSSVSIDFIVSDTIGLAIRNLINYPNPFRDYTYFSFEHNQFNETLSVTIDIWALTGAWIKRIGPSDIQAEGYQASSLFWDGKDYQGNTVSRGVYIYHLTLDNKKESSKTLVGKLIVMD